MMTETISQELKDAVKNKLTEFQSSGGNISDLARRAKTSRQHLYSILNGSRWKNPGLDKILNLTRELDIDEDIIYRGIMVDVERARRVKEAEAICSKGLDDFLDIILAGTDDPKAKKLLAEMEFLKKQ